MSDTEVLIQQLIIGLSNGMIIALIALGYTMVYGLIELINFAHGDLFMLGAFCALTFLGITGVEDPYQLLPLLIAIPIFCAALNWLIERVVYRPLRSAPKLVQLVSAVGVSFIFINIGLFWGGSSPRDFPNLIPDYNLLSLETPIYFGLRDLLVYSITIPLLVLLTFLVKRTQLGRAMRAIAQNQTAARLVGVDVDRVISLTFVIGGALAGVASIVYAIYNSTVFFQIGYRVGLDAFTAAVLGGIGHLGGAVLGGILIGILRAMSDQYVSPEWTNSVVFGMLIVALVFRPGGLLGRIHREKV